MSKKTKKKAAKPVKKQAKPSAVRPSAGKPVKPAAKPAPKAAVAAKPKRKAASSWLDGASQKPVIDRYARQLKSFLNAMADGKIDDSELQEQEQRLIALMKEIEPQLDDALHARVTEVLCELTAYDLRQTLHSINAQRPKTVFHG